jgi:hypothetical protein
LPATAIGESYGGHRVISATEEETERVLAQYGPLFASASGFTGEGEGCSGGSCLEIFVRDQETLQLAKTVLNNPFAGVPIQFRVTGDFVAQAQSVSAEPLPPARLFAQIKGFRGFDSQSWVCLVADPAVAAAANLLWGGPVVNGQGGFEGHPVRFVAMGDIQAQTEK